MMELLNPKKTKEHMLIHHSSIPLYNKTDHAGLTWILIAIYSTAAILWEHLGMRAFPVLCTGLAASLLRRWRGSPAFSGQNLPRTLNDAATTLSSL